MSKLDEVKAEIQAVKEHIAAEAAEVQASVKVLEDQIVALKAQVAEGNAATQPDLDDLIVKLKEIQTGVDNIITPPVETEGGGGPGPGDTGP